MTVNRGGGGICTNTFTHKYADMHTCLHIYIRLVIFLTYMSAYVGHCGLTFKVEHLRGFEAIFEKDFRILVREEGGCFGDKSQRGL